MKTDDPSQFVARVGDCIRAHGLLPSVRKGAGAEPVIVGVSGGADSVALLLALHDLGRSGLAVALTVAHLHHGLRETTADEDEVFVKNLAAKLGLPCTVDRANVRAEAERDRLTIEEAARNTRRSFLADAARRAGARKVALGHTADDRAETVLFNVLRGTGLEGLAALGPRALLPSPLMGEGGRRRRPGEGEPPLTLPSPARGEGKNGGSPVGGRGGEAIEIIRPLVDISRAEVRAFLEARGQAWREDETNEDTAFARNRLRREVLPLLREAANPKVDEALLRLADQAADAADVLADALDAAWSQIVRETPTTDCHSEVAAATEESRRAANVCVPRPALPGRANADENSARRDETRRGTQAIVIDADDFALLRPWLQGAILRRAVEKLGGGLKHMSAERTRAAVEALLSGSVAGPVELPGGLSATRRRRTIRIERRLST
jgi:tRNA(Ile)-lysidine synthetase-like protein